MTTTPPLQETAAVQAEPALADALATVRRNIATFGPLYPDDCTRGDLYHPRPRIPGFAEGANQGWTTSFVPGMQWLAWELTGHPDFRDAALGHAADFDRRLREGHDIDMHDLGFLYTLASVAPWRLLGDESARATALRAADHLMTRFLEPAGIIQAWGDLSDPAQRGRTIIDSLMNMPLLTWAYEQTGEERYADAVRRHTAQLREHIIREDDSTFHTFFWDAETGEPVRGSTAQGAHDDSCWARGQAWGIYGFALNHRATDDPELLDAAWRCADYFLAHLPSDDVPYWDLVFTDGSGAPRDSSAAAIAVCGFQELAALEPGTDRGTRAALVADLILDSLIENYTPEKPEDSDALILHSVYHFNGGSGIDEGSLWGDYFYLEALTRRALRGWRPYW